MLVTRLILPYRPAWPRRSAPAQVALSEPQGELPRPLIDRSHVIQAGNRGRTAPFVGLHRLPDDLGNRCEAQPGLQKLCHRHFVGGVQDNREPRIALERPKGERETGKPFRIRRFELQPARPRQVEPLEGSAPALRIRKRILNW